MGYTATMLLLLLERSAVVTHTTQSFFIFYCTSEFLLLCVIRTGQFNSSIDSTVDGAYTQYLNRFPYHHSFDDIFNLMQTEHKL